MGLNSRTARQVACSLVLAAGVLASGCLYSATDHVKETGAPISRGNMRLILPGKTPADYLVAKFGEPQAVRKLEDGGQVHQYVTAQQKTSRRKLFLVFSTSKTTTTVTTRCFEVRDGVVQRYWTEEQ